MNTYLIDNGFNPPPSPILLFRGPPLESWNNAPKAWPKLMIDGSALTSKVPTS